MRGIATIRLLNQLALVTGALSTNKLILVIILPLMCCATPTFAWGNGGYTIDLGAVKYGTHDWIAQHALDWVPANMIFWIRDNLNYYLYGTELPDNRNAILGDGIGDTTYHHVYYKATGQLQDDASARRAKESLSRVVTYLNVKDYQNAAKWMGTATHYVADISCFAHVMGKNTDWGDEKHHEDYENWVLEFTNQYASPSTYLRFDGSLDLIDIYNATLKLAYDTTFDTSGQGRTCKWMDTNYDKNDPAFKARAEESLNLAVNTICDVIYTVSASAGIPEFPQSVVIPFLVLVSTLILLRTSTKFVKTRKEQRVYS